MKRILIFSALLLAAGAELSAQAGDGPRIRSELRPAPSSAPALKAGGAKTLDPASRADKACVLMNIELNQTVNGELTPDDCDLGDGTVIDFWEFSGTAGQTVVITQDSNEFDSFLFLIDPALETAATDDDSGGGFNSRIEFTLDQTGLWTIGANGFGPADLGAYTLSLSSGREIRLLNDRFQVEVDWRNAAGETGEGRVVPFGSNDSGLFWFFDPDNWEMLVKMVDACNSPFNSFWVFLAATTDVEYTVTVTDTQTGATKEYFNPLNNAAAAVTDTQAFSTCP